MQARRLLCQERTLPSCTLLTCPPPKHSEDIDFKYYLREACRAEVPLLCGGVQHGYARVIRCLQVRPSSSQTINERGVLAGRACVALLAPAKTRAPGASTHMVLRSCALPLVSAPPTGQD